MNLTITSIGDFNQTTKWLAIITSNKKPQELETLGHAGVNALAAATPKDTGLTASSWGYEVVRTGSGWDLVFYNTAHPETRVPVALLIQYGHGTKNGGYVPPIDYINPAMSSIMKNAATLLSRSVLDIG